jgi:hypothetical protein
VSNVKWEFHLDSNSECVIPKTGLVQPGEGSRVQPRSAMQVPIRLLPFGQPLRAGSSLPQEYGFVQDDAFRNQPTVRWHRNVRCRPGEPEVSAWKG